MSEPDASSKRSSLRSQPGASGALGALEERGDSAPAPHQVHHDLDDDLDDDLDHDLDEDDEEGTGVALGAFGPHAPHQVDVDNFYDGDNDDDEDNYDDGDP